MRLRCRWERRRGVDNSGGEGVVLARVLFGVLVSGGEGGVVLARVLFGVLVITVLFMVLVW